MNRDYLYSRTLGRGDPSCPSHTEEDLDNARKKKMLIERGIKLVSACNVECDALEKCTDAEKTFVIEKKINDLLKELQHVEEEIKHVNASNNKIRFTGHGY